MGFGCNACGVTGCRIIDSPRERLIAILTNSFAPCNGRFPLLIFLCAVFFDAGSAGGALLLTSVIAGSVLLTPSFCAVCPPRSCWSFRPTARRSRAG